MIRSIVVLIIISANVLFALGQPGSGYCLKFDGNNFVDCGNPAGSLFELTNNGTIEAWVKVLKTPPAANSSVCYSILAKDESAGEFNKWIFGVQDGKLVFHINSTDANHNWVYSDPFVLLLNKYYHFAMTKSNNDVVTFFVNGSFMGTSKLPHVTTIVNSDMLIGNSEPGLEMVGEIDEVRFWKRALIQNELRDWMCRKVNQGHPAYPDLAANYSLNEGGGLLTKNYNGNSSQLINNPEWLTSAAPIGDEAAVDFSNVVKSASLTNLSGERFTASITVGMPEGIIAYRVDETPNTVAGINASWNNANYFGVFVAEVNSSSPVYSATYNYAGNPLVTPSNECSLRFYKRSNNADTPWGLTTNTQNFNNHSVSLSGGSAEYILAGDNIKKTATVIISSNDTDNIICAGSTVKFTATVTNGGPNPNYQWLLNGDSVGDNNSVCFLNSLEDKALVECKLTSSEACIIPATRYSNKIILHVPNGVKLGNDTGFCSSEGLLLLVKDSFSVYQWSTGAGTNSISVAKPGTYWVQTTDHYNCTSQDTIRVIEKPCGFFIPNTFSPNNDGRNDTFKPVLSGAVKGYSFEVYNRWGVKIFRTNIPGTGWDGYYKAQMQLPGQYVWICEFQLPGQSLTRKTGSFLLLR